MATISQQISAQEFINALGDVCIKRVGSQDLGKMVLIKAFKVLMEQEEAGLKSFQSTIKSALSTNGQISVEDQRALAIYMNSYLASLQLR